MFYQFLGTLKLHIRDKHQDPKEEGGRRGGRRGKGRGGGRALVLPCHSPNFNQCKSYCLSAEVVLVAVLVKS